MDRRLHLGDGDIENFFELPSSELDRPSEGDIFYDSDIDPEYRPSDDSPESENEQLSVDNTVLSADLINSSEDSETFHDETDIETSINQPNQQESFDPGEGTSSHQDTGTTNNQSREQGNGRSSFQRQAQKTKVTWKEVTRSFNPKHVMPPTKAPIVLANVQRNSSELHVFLQVFPKSLLMFISHCTNERLKILMNKKKTKIEMTDYHEMMIIHGCILIMCYNRLPNISDYWSMQESMGNRAIIRAISRNRFQLLISKLYFNIPDKPVNSNKTYYIDEVVSCLKSTFSKARSESTFQSIDESMAKFKGKSAMKQYLPLKPIKRGIKIWERCDSYTGYCYDFNIYAGKETDNVDGTLGERVVGKLSSSIQTEKKQVVLAFDRFFTSVKLLSEIEHPSVATCIGNRVNVPKFDTKIEKYGSDFLCCDEGVLAVAWKDSKQFVVLSNFHKNTVSTVKRMQKDGHKIDVPCPDAIILYNQIMGGVDLSDQKAGVYDFDRKSKKWWKKVFYKLFLTAVVNAWILHREVTHKKTPLLSFIVPLAEQLLDAGLMHTLNKRRRNTGRPSKRVKMMNNVGDHLPIQLEKRRRCKRCSDQKIEKRTKTFCRECQLPLCNDCFTLYHE